MVSSMPLVALQFLGRILLERSLLYREVALVEVSQVLCYHTWNIATVLAGFGVWGLATGAIVRAAVGALAMAVVVPTGNVRPIFDRAAIRPLIGFGIRFQAVNATMLVRDLLLNFTVAALAGVTALGEWSLVRRIMEVPFLLFYSFSRVSLPAVPQLLAAGREAKPLVERVAALSAVGAGFVLTAIAGGAPGLVPGVFGDQWSTASGAVALSCLAVGLSGCLTSVKAYLYAIDDVSAVLHAGLVTAAVWFAVSMPLLPFLGVTAVGIGWVAASIAETVVLARKSRRRAAIRLLPPLIVPVSVGVLSATAGWVVSVHLGRHLLSGVAGSILAVAIFAVGLLLFRRRVTIDTISFAVQSVRLAVTARRDLR
jgi:polysaccharide transporter, PST family